MGRVEYGARRKNCISHKKSRASGRISIDDETRSKPLIREKKMAETRYGKFFSTYEATPKEIEMGRTGIARVIIGKFKLP
jgi:hypothetical protein